LFAVPPLHCRCGVSFSNESKIEKNLHLELIE
jgi:hypothetical protein